MTKQYRGLAPDVAFSDLATPIGTKERRTPEALSVFPAHSGGRRHTVRGVHESTAFLTGLLLPR